MSRPRMVLFAFAVVVLAVALCRARRRRRSDRTSPSRVVIIVLDQARPDTITRYGMTNVQRLQRKGKSFPTRSSATWRPRP